MLFINLLKKDKTILKFLTAENLAYLENILKHNLNFFTY